MDLPLWELELRLVLAAVLCALVGLERELRGQPAGLRTHLVVGVGAVLFTLVSAYGFPEFSRDAGPGGVPRFDPTRIAAQVVSGVGFLGAGAILRQGASVRGLTTAGTLWVVAALGLAVGSGFYAAAVLATALVVPAIVALRRVRGPLVRRLAVGRTTLDLRLRPDALDDVLAVLEAARAEVRGIDAEIEGGVQTVALELRLARGTDAVRLLRDVSAVDGVHRAGGAGLRPGDLAPEL